MYGLYQLALLDICMINIGSVIGIGRFWQKYNRYRYNQKLPYRYTSTQLYHNFNSLMATSGTLCHRFVMHPFLIMLGIRPLCPSLWGIVFLHLSLLAVVLVHRVFVLNCYLTVLPWLCHFFSTYSREGVSFCLSVLFDQWSLPVVDNPSKAQHIFQHSVDLHHYSSLLDSVSNSARSG